MGAGPSCNMSAVCWEPFALRESDFLGHESATSRARGRRQRAAALHRAASLRPAANAGSLTHAPRGAELGVERRPHVESPVRHAQPHGREAPASVRRQGRDLVARESGALNRDDRQLASDEAAEARSLGEALSTPRRGCGQLLDDACPQHAPAHAPLHGRHAVVQDQKELRPNLHRPSVDGALSSACGGLRGGHAKASTAADGERRQRRASARAQAAHPAVAPTVAPNGCRARPNPSPLGTHWGAHHNDKGPDGQGDIGLWSSFVSQAFDVARIAWPKLALVAAESNGSLS